MSDVSAFGRRGSQVDNRDFVDFAKSQITGEMTAIDFGW